MKIILGSSSKYRRELLEKNGYDVEVMAPDINEKAIRSNDYYQLPLLVARAKSNALLSKISEPSIVITADIIVVCDGALYEKPQNKKEAVSFLKKYGSGHPAETVGALVVTNTENNKKAEGIDIAKVYFNFMPPAVIEDFINSGDPYSKAGGFAIQSPILQPYINRIEGATDSIMGMPLTLLERLLKEVT